MWYIMKTIPKCSFTFIASSILSTSVIAGATPPPPPLEYLDNSPITIDGDLSEWKSLTDKYEVESTNDGLTLWATEKKRSYTYNGKKNTHYQTIYGLKIEKNASILDIKSIQLKHAYSRKSDGQVLLSSKCLQYKENGGVGQTAKPVFEMVCEQWEPTEAGYFIDIKKDFSDQKLPTFIQYIATKETDDALYYEFSTTRRDDKVFYIDRRFENQELPMDNYNQVSRVAVTFDNNPNGVTTKVMPQCESNGGCGQHFPHSTVLSIAGNTPAGKVSISVGMTTTDEGSFDWNYSEDDVSSWSGTVGLTVFEGVNDLENIMDDKYSVYTAPVPGCAICQAGFVVDNLGQVIGITATASTSKNTATIVNASYAKMGTYDFRGIPEYVVIDDVHLVVDSHHSGNDGGNYGGPGDDKHGNDHESNHSGGVNENSDGCQGCNTPWGGR